MIAGCDACRNSSAFSCVRESGLQQRTADVPHSLLQTLAVDGRDSTQENPTTYINNRWKKKRWSSSIDTPELS
jgi:hypothetical protein